MKKLVYLLSLILFVSCGNDSTKEQSEVKANSENSNDSLVSVEKEDPTPSLGQSAQIVIGTSNYSETVRFYETLGWKTTASEIDPWKWNLLYDGSTMLMITEDTINYLGFGYHSNEAINVYVDLLKSEIKPMMSVNNPETNEVWFNVYDSPDSVSFSVVNEALEMMEVTNAGEIFSAATGTKFEFVNPIVGTYQEFALSVEDLDESIKYWKNLGFENNGIKDQPYRYTIAYDGLMILGLHETKGMWDGNVLTYSGHGVEENKSAVEVLQANGFALDVEEMVWDDMVFEGNFLIPDPAGNVFMLTTDLTVLKK